MAHFVKRRGPAQPGSIPDVLGMFTAEVRFYREIAPLAGLRVPACYESSIGPEGTRLVLEDLSAWSPGADPVQAVRVYADLHARFLGVAERRWPWLRRVGLGAELVGDLYDRTWPHLSARHDLSPVVRRFAAGMVGRAADAERATVAGAALTLIHGDASSGNQRTSPSGEIALLDWEDVGVNDGIADIAWFLVSSVEPGRWEEVLDAYGHTGGLGAVQPAAMVQGLFSLHAAAEGSEDADRWVRRLEAAADRLWAGIRGV